MVIKASILLLLSWVSITVAHSAATFESSVREAALKNDWPELVLLLTPRKGQSFEHDLLLSKALLQLERRAESIAILIPLYAQHREERVLKLLQGAGSIFFNQETSNLYFEGVRMLSVLKFGEAKERFDQALAKEPGNILVLTRLVQVEILLGQVDPAAAHLKEALACAPYSYELKVFSLELAPTPEVTLKKPLLKDEVPFVIWLKHLKQKGKLKEIKGAIPQVLESDPDRAYVRIWLYHSGIPSPAEQARLKMQIDRAVKNRSRFEEQLENQMKQSQYYWAGVIRYEDLVKQMR